MASISKQKNGGKVIQFFPVDNTGRKSLYLGNVSMEFAREAKRHVEALLRAQVEQTVPDRPVLEWIGRLNGKLRKKFHTLGLIEQPLEEKQADEKAKAEAKPRLGQFLAEFFTRRVDVKPATKEVWGQTKRNLLDFFGADRTLETISAGEADDFKMYLIGENLASTTVHKRLQFARMFFRNALRRKVIASNPFAEVTSKATISSDRQEFIPRDHIARLLEACSNLEWRVIISLSRFGGLRCPSEVLSLKRENVDWTRDRIRVYSPKTEHHPGKESREIPLFPELRAVLMEAFESAPDGAEYVVGGNYRTAAQGPAGWRNCNLRTQFERIIRHAGLEPWPRLFHALRASRETELAAEYPIHVVTAWMGNTPKIAMKHYLMVTDADFQKAMQNPMQSNDNSMQNPVQQGKAIAAQTRTELSRNNTSPCETRACASLCASERLDAGIISGEGGIRTLGPPYRKSRI